MLVIYPFPDQRSVLVMDNCRIHHTNALQNVLNVSREPLHHSFIIMNLMEWVDIMLLYLSPHSPDLNPIEESFSTWRAHLHRNGAILQTAKILFSCCLTLLYILGATAEKVVIQAMGILTPPLLPTTALHRHHEGTVHFWPQSEPAKASENRQSPFIHRSRSKSMNQNRMGAPAVSSA